MRWSIARILPAVKVSIICYLTILNFLIVQAILDNYLSNCSNDKVSHNLFLIYFSLL
jgi:hypothetical protein